MSYNTSMRLLILSLLGWFVMPSTLAWAQAAPKPQRALPPKLSEQEFEGIFFSDVKSVLQGSRPTANSPAASPATMASGAASGSTASQTAGSQTGGSQAGGSQTGGTAPGSHPGWDKLISGATIEDIVKNSKLRLEPLVATPTKFAGAFKEARREYSLQSLMFAIIEEYPGDVRWKKSAAQARAAFMASPQITGPKAHQNGRERVQDLADLLSGNTLRGATPPKLDWANVIERVPLMQLLEWAQQDYIKPHSASQPTFAQNKEELKRYAELVAVLGKATIIDGMHDAEDPEYRQLAEDMIEQAQQITVAVQTDNADLARSAAGQLGQACIKCHEGYR